ncbi:hypothetical protein FXO37_03560 [Capsicum annuum]|nr:hypothetical protein FXO37_03560 [Capsicum annuum]
MLVVMVEVVGGGDSNLMASHKLNWIDISLIFWLSRLYFQIGLTSDCSLDDFKVAIAKYISSPPMSDTNLKVLHKMSGLSAKALVVLPCYVSLEVGQFVIAKLATRRIMGDEGLLLEIFNKFVNELKEKERKRHEHKKTGELVAPLVVPIEKRACRFGFPEFLLLDYIHIGITTTRLLERPNEEFLMKSSRMKNSSEPASPAVANSEKIGIVVNLGNFVSPPVSETTTTQDAVVYGDGFSLENRENVKKDAAITEIRGATPSDEKIVKLGPLVYKTKAVYYLTVLFVPNDCGRLFDVNCICHAMRVVINDRRYGALKSLCEQKQAFNEDCKELSPSSRWSKSISIVEHDKRFKAVERAKDREDLFEDYVEELEKKVKLLLQNFLEHVKALEEQKCNRVEYLEFLKSCDFIKCTASRTAATLFRTDAMFHEMVYCFRKLLQWLK